MTTYLDSGGQPVRLGPQLGVGGQGAVYAVANRADVVAKIYLQAPEARAARKLAALVQAGDPRLESVSAWPQTVLRDAGGGVSGFLMPLVPASEYHELHLLYRPSSRQQHFPKADWRFLVHVARNVARAFAALHAAGPLMGDVSSRNVMVSGQGTVRFIDTDSFQVRVGPEVFPCPVGTAEFTPPELQGRGFGSLVREVDHDLFGLALLLFHLLFEGRHPYAGVHDDGAMPSPAQAIAGDKFAYSLRHRHGVRPPPFTPTLQGLPEPLRDLFEQAFSPRHVGRPGAAQWEAALGDLFSHIVTCARNPGHQHDRRVPCPWCALLPANAQAATAKTGTPAAAKRLDVEAELNRIWQGVRAVPVPPAPAPLALTAGVAPLPLPALPPLPAVTGGFSKSAATWGTLCLLAALGSLQHPGWLTLVLAVLAWYNFNKNSAGNVNRRRAALAEQHRAQQQQTYRALLDRHLEQHLREADDLRRQISQAYARLQDQGAQARYRAALQKLEAQRAELRALQHEEQRQLQAVVERHRRPLLERYLTQQPIRPGVVNGIGPSVVASLNQKGFVTARDITPDVRWVKGVGPKRQQDLLEWRETLEQFFQFNPSQIPAREFETVRDQFEAQRANRLGQLERSVGQFAQGAPAWPAAEQVIVREIHDLRLELARREKTIDLIRQGVPQLN